METRRKGSGTGLPTHFHYLSILHPLVPSKSYQLTMLLGVLLLGVLLLVHLLLAAGPGLPTRLLDCTSSRYVPPPFLLFGPPFLTAHLAERC